MSNVIKAYSIKYSEDKRIVDTNAAAEAKVQSYLDLLKSRDLNNLDDTENEQHQDDDFVQGLVAATVEELPDGEGSPNPKLTAEQIEEFQIQQELSRKQMQEESEHIIAEAKAEVKRILEEGKAQADTLAIQIKEAAKQEGFDAGMADAEEKLSQAKEELIQKQKQLEDEYEKKVKDFEPVFADLLISFIKKITGVVIEDKKEIIIYLLEQELLNIESSNSYIIRVSRDDYEMVNTKKNEIAWKISDNAEIEIIEDRLLSRNQCMIETDSRIIDCSIDVQLKNLISDLKLLAGTRE